MAIFVPIKNRPSRIILGVFFLFAFLYNLGEFIYEAADNNWKLYDLGALVATIFDALVSIAFFVKPTNKINKVTPFMAIDETVENADGDRI